MRSSLLRFLERVACAVVLSACVAFDLAAAGDVVAAAADGSLWKETKSQLGKGLLKNARYAQVDERTLRFRGGRSLPVAGLVTRDVVMQWDEEQHVATVTTTIYNKGDDGSLDKNAFEQKVKESMTAISSALQVEPKVRKVNLKEAGVKPRAWEWENESCAIMLEAHSTGSGKRFVSEFIRLTIVPSKDKLERGGADDAAKRADLRGNVRRDDDGSVWIDGIPMVDQGEKGYCVPAAISRVFAYYGMDGVDQHALAAICKSSGEQGTTIEAMNKALTSISSRFHVGITSWMWTNRKTLYKDMVKLAQRNPSASEAALLLKAVESKPAVLKKGVRDIRKYIDSGIPIVWGVMLGMYPEQGLPQSMGGHMRLIIGYNEENDRIIYSDSWGKGHERKEMPMSQACAITHVLYVLRPLR